MLAKRLSKLSKVFNLIFLMKWKNSVYIDMIQNESKILELFETILRIDMSNDDDYTEEIKKIIGEY